MATRTKRWNGEGSIYLRPDGLWAAAVSTTWPDGTAKRKTVYGKTRKEVADKLHEL